MLSYKLFENKSVEEIDIVAQECTLSVVHDLKYKNILCNELSIDSEMFLMTYKSVSFNGTKIKPNDIVLLKWLDEDEMPKFVKVLMILKIETNFTVLIQHLHTIHFEEHYHAYLVRHLEKHSICNMSELDLVKPLLWKATGENIMTKLPFTCS